MEPTNSRQPEARGNQVRVDAQGRILIPEHCLEAAGLKAGDVLLVDVIGEGELRLRSPGQAVRAAQAIVARYVPKGRDLVQELIDERRAEAARENEKFERLLSPRRSKR